VVHTVLPVPEAPEVSGFGLDVVPLVEAMTDEARREMFSRKDSDFNRGTVAADAAPPTA
jgi:hypothetical protein